MTEKAELTRDTREKRVAVAKDVLAQLDRQDVPLRLRRGNYLIGAGNRDEAIAGTHEATADYLQSHCQVCMIGAAFVSYSRLFGGTSHLVKGGRANVYAYSEDMVETLSSVFDATTLELIESVFEQDNMSRSDDDDILDACFAACEWGLQFTTPESAARAICQLLIDNNGELLIPSQEPANV